MPELEHVLMNCLKVSTSGGNSLLLCILVVQSTLNDQEKKEWGTSRRLKIRVDLVPTKSVKQD